MATHQLAVVWTNPSTGDAGDPTTPVIDIYLPDGTLAIDGAAMSKVDSKTGYYGYNYTLPSGEGVYWYYIHGTIGGITHAYPGVFTLKDGIVYANQAIVFTIAAIGPSDGLYIPVAVNLADGTADTPSALTCKIYDDAGSEQLDLGNILANIGDNTGEYYVSLTQANIVALGEGTFQAVFTITDSASDTPLAIMNFTVSGLNTGVPTISNVASSPASPTVEDQITVTFDISGTSNNTEEARVQIDDYIGEATVTSGSATCTLPAGRIRAGTFNIDIMAHIVDSTGEQWGILDISTQVTVSDVILGDPVARIIAVLSDEWDTSYVAQPTIRRITESKSWDVNRSNLCLLYKRNREYDYKTGPRSHRTIQDHVTVDLRTKTQGDLEKIHREALRCLDTRLTTPGGGYSVLEVNEGELDKSNKRRKIYWVIIEVTLKKLCGAVRTAKYS